MNNRFFFILCAKFIYSNKIQTMDQFSLQSFSWDCWAPAWTMQKQADKNLQLVARSPYNLRGELEKMCGTLKKIKDLGFNENTSKDLTSLILSVIPNAFQSQLDAAGLKMIASTGITSVTGAKDRGYHRASWARYTE